LPDFWLFLHMTEADPHSRIERALEHGSPAEALAALAAAFKAEGLSQQQLYQLFDELRARHQNDGDETKYNAILDTLDRIAGWCSLQARLFDSQSHRER
jgi:hypothetical protein